MLDEFEELLATEAVPCKTRVEGALSREVDEDVGDTKDPLAAIGEDGDCTEPLVLPLDMVLIAVYDAYVAWGPVGGRSPP